MLPERETELAVLHRALRDAEAGRGSSVVITGPLGAGRSALLRALRTASGECRRLWASGAVSEQDLGFGVVRQLFELLMTDLPADVSDRWWWGAAGAARPVFAGVTGDGCPGLTQEALLDGLLALVANISVEQPLALLVDDLQWADAASLRWLGYLVNRLDRLRVAVVVTVLDGDPHGEQPLLREISRAASSTLRPKPLSPKGVAEVVEESFGAAADHEFVRACHDVTAGDPLHLTSVLTELRLDGCRPVRAQAHLLQLVRPALLRERLVTCFRTLPPVVREVAKAVATIEEADIDLVGRVADVDRLDCTEAIAALRRLGVVASDSPLRLRHRAAKDAAEELMTVEESARLHQRVLAQLSDYGVPAERLATHLTAVTSALDPWEIATLREAAAKAFDGGEPEVAARYLRRALLDNATSADRATLLVELATAEREFDTLASVQHVSQAIRSLGSPAQRASAVVRLGMAAPGESPLSLHGLIARATDELGDPRQLSWPERDLALRLEARRQFLELLEAPGQVTRCVRRLRTLVPTPSLETPGERELVAVLLFAETVAGEARADEVASVVRRILESEPASPEHVHTGLGLLAPTLIAADAVSDMSSWIEAVRQVAGPRRGTLTHSLLSVEHALLLAHRGKMTQARARGLEAFEAHGREWRNNPTLSMVMLSLVAVETRDGEMIGHLVDSTDSHAAHNDNMLMAAILRLLRGWTAARHDPPTALHHILDCGHHLDRVGWRNPALFPWRLLAAVLHDRLGDRDRADELLQEHSALAETWGAPATVGQALRVRGELSRDGEGIQLLRKATDVLAASENSLELVKAHFVLGKRLSAIGEPDGEEHVRKALVIGEQYGMRWFAEQARSAATVVAPRAAADGPTLTETERRVALLAAEGRTNQEIADDIGVTTRAVEKNLTKTYRKLGVRGRGELDGALLSM